MPKTQSLNFFYKLFIKSNSYFHYLAKYTQSYFRTFPLKRIRYLTIRFDTDLYEYELPAFRGAIAELAGREHPLFHNHLSSDQFLYRYPVIQYKRIGGNPAIVCLEEGVDEIHHLFSNASWDVRIGDRPVQLRIKDMRLNQFTMQAWEHRFPFRIRNWLALNQKNYELYQELSGLVDRVAFLERILTGNILSLAKGLDWRIDREVIVRIDDLSPLRLLRFKDQLLAGFDADFSTNVFLPDFIGLGKGVSTGFGVVTRKRAEGRKGQEQDNQQITHQDDEKY